MTTNTKEVPCVNEVLRERSLVGIDCGISKISWWEQIQLTYTSFLRCTICSPQFPVLGLFFSPLGGASNTIEDGPVDQIKHIYYVTGLNPLM